MIKIIKTIQTYPLRNLVLRPDRPIETCYFDYDDEPSTFHLGYYVDGINICIATFVQNEYRNIQESYQLRGMATHPDYRSKGYGQKIIEFSVTELRRREAQQLWCNARVKAQEFYIRHGFLVDSDDFIIDDVGLHKKMLLKL